MSVYKGCPEYETCRELWGRIVELSPRAYFEFRCDDCNSYQCYCDGYLQGAEDALQAVNESLGHTQMHVPFLRGEKDE